MTNNSWPTTLEEAVQHILASYSPQQRQFCQKVKDGESLAFISIDLLGRIYEQLALENGQNKQLIADCAQRVIDQGQALKDPIETTEKLISDTVWEQLIPYRGPLIQTFHVGILGLPDAGKETFIQNISTDYGPGWVEVDDDLFIFCQKVQVLNVSDLSWILENKRGCIMLVDSTRRDELAEVTIVLEAYQAACQIPLIIAANKQDKPGALTSDEMRQALRIPQGVETVPCVALQTGSTQTVLLKLLNTIVQAMDRENP